MKNASVTRVLEGRVNSQNVFLVNPLARSVYRSSEGLVRNYRQTVEWPRTESQPRLVSEMPTSQQLKSVR